MTPWSGSPALALVLTALAAPLAAQQTTPPAESQEHPYPDCFCTDRSGARVELGQEICLVVDGRAFMARCEMVLNNPFWRDTGRACLSSGLPRSLAEPLGQPG